MRKRRRPAKVRMGVSVHASTGGRGWVYHRQRHGIFTDLLRSQHKGVVLKNTEGLGHV